MAQLFIIQKQCIVGRSEKWQGTKSNPDDRCGPASRDRLSVQRAMNHLKLILVIGINVHHNVAENFRERQLNFVKIE